MGGPNDVIMIMTNISSGPADSGMPLRGRGKAKMGVSGLFKLYFAGRRIMHRRCTLICWYKLYEFHRQMLLLWDNPPDG